MALKQFFQNASQGLENALYTAKSAIKSKLEGIVGSAKASFSSLWDGGFAGIDQNGAGALEQALKNYVQNAEETIALFNSQNKFGEALKGKVLDAMVDYSQAIKELLQAYVTTMKVNITDMRAAFDAYMQQTDELAANVSSDAEAIRSQAASIRLD